MGNNPFFSVVVPVYNVEKYLEKCINSVLSQTFIDFELLLVDDGSPDNSSKICDEFAAEDQRVKVVHKENKGSSDARNVGLEISTGEYILFLDSDDYWDERSALLQLHTKLMNQKSDILLFGCRDYDVEKQKYLEERGNYDLDTFLQSKPEILRYLLTNNLFPGAAWILSVKRSLLIQNNITFRVGVKGEDIEWLVAVFLKAEKINAINSSFYVYLKNRSNSVTAIPDKKSVLGILYAIDTYKDIVRASDSKELLRFLQYEYLIAVMIVSRVRQNKQELFNMLKRHTDLLDFKYAVSLKSKISVLIIKFAGVEKGSFVMNFINNRLK